MSYDYYDWYEPTVPKEVKGGIRAKSRWGAFASNWWGQRWIQTLEDFNIGARLGRGRSYARKGQVAALKILKGSVQAEVQGSEYEPYIVSIKFKVLTEKQWDHIIVRLLEKPIFAALLLGNEMPRDIESVFKDEGLSLFPEGEKDMETSCSCPDWSNPCKHIAAVFYLMGEAFDNDPFLLFKIRGMEKEVFIKALRSNEEEDKRVMIEPEPLPADYNKFWGQDRSFDRAISIMPADLHAAMPKRLGTIPFWRSERDFIGEMEAIYKNASAHAKDLFEKDFGKDKTGS